jgi:hypothetical protein
LLLNFDGIGGGGGARDNILEELARLAIHHDGSKQME